MKGPSDQILLSNLVGFCSFQSSPPFHRYSRKVVLDLAGDRVVFCSGIFLTIEDFCFIVGLKFRREGRHLI